MEIKEFKGKYKFLDNFYTCSVLYNNLLFANSEDAFQAEKCINVEDKVEFTNLSPYKAKQKGRNVKLRPDWEQIKDRVMYDIVLAKFTQNKDLRLKLLETGDAYLEEGNHHKDTYWGTVDSKGKNKLGKILAKIREELR